MSYKKLILIVNVIIASICSVAAQEKVDTIYNPPISYSGVPRTYELAGIKVTGAPNYEDYIIIGYSGLRIGQEIQVPGADISTAAKRLVRETPLGQQ